jgi:hypothetical protein
MTDRRHAGAARWSGAPTGTHGSSTSSTGTIRMPRTGTEGHTGIWTPQAVHTIVISLGIGSRVMRVKESHVSDIRFDETSLTRSRDSQAFWQFAARVRLSGLACHCGTTATSRSSLAEKKPTALVSSSRTSHARRGKVAFACPTADERRPRGRRSGAGLVDARSSVAQTESRHSAAGHFGFMS